MVALSGRPGPNEAGLHPQRASRNVQPRQKTAGDDDAMNDEQRVEDLRDHSDRLFDQLQELKSLESEKRQEEISTPAFHALVDAADQKGREIFRTVSDEARIADSIDHPQGTSIDADGTRKGA